MHPFFSIIIPTHNRLDLLKIAIESVQKQLFEDWELIIVNDASTDKTKDYLDSIKNDKIKIIHNEINLYKGGTRNEGIKIAKGKYICFLDDDDYYLENHLQVFYDTIVEKNYPLASFYTMPISQDIKTKEFTKRNLAPLNTSNPVAYLFHHKNGVPTPRLCIHSDILKKHLFNPKVKIGQDTELLLRIAADYPVYAINKHTAVQVRHENNSGALYNDTGKQRLAGYKSIFKNPVVNQYLSRKLKRYMISYCYLRSADHFNFVKNRKQTLISALKSLYYSPFDSNLKIKLVYILYNLPGGKFFKLIVSKIK